MGKLRNEEFHGLHLPPDIVRLTKSWSLIGVGYGIGKGQVKNCRKCLLTKYEGWNFNSGNYLFTTDTK